MYTRARYWWASGSTPWQRLAVCGTLAVGGFVSGLAVDLLGGGTALAFGLALVAAAALGAGGFILMMARAGGEGVHSPGWYRRFQQDVHARAANRR
ncbi:hypothetical protein [Streptomyces sp. NPDC055607]